MVFRATSFGSYFFEPEMILLRGESKFEISTLSVNPTLRGWGGQVLDAKDCNFCFLNV